MISTSEYKWPPWAPGGREQPHLPNFLQIISPDFKNAHKISLKFCSTVVSSCNLQAAGYYPDIRWFTAGTMSYVQGQSRLHKLLCFGTKSKTVCGYYDWNGEYHLIQGNLKGNLLWRPSCRHVWRRVIVPPDFFVAKPAK